MADLKKNALINGQVEIFDVNDIKSVYGQLPNSQILVIGYLEKIITLIKKLHKCQVDFKQSSDVLAKESSRSKD